MAAADRPGHVSSSRITAFLRKLLAGLVSTRPPDQYPDAAAAPTRRTPIDPGDLAVAQLVHDLRNQLIVIDACADQLADMVPAGLAQQRLDHLRQHAEQGLVLARHVLTATTPPEDRRPVNLNHAITRYWTTLALVMGPRHRLQLHLSSEPLRVVARTVELERIVLNLALNAREAIAGDGIVTIETSVE